MCGRGEDVVDPSDASKDGGRQSAKRVSAVNLLKYNVLTIANAGLRIVIYTGFNVVFVIIWMSQFLELKSHYEFLDQIANVENIILKFITFHI